MANEWFVFINGEEQGPFAYSELADLARAGTVKPATPLRYGDQQVTRADTFLGDVFRKRKSRRLVVSAVSVGVLILSGAGLFIWHKFEATTAAVGPIRVEARRLPIPDAPAELQPVHVTPIPVLAHAPVIQAAAPVSSESDLQQLVSEVEPGVVTIRTDRGQGSGALVDIDGIVATNHHVVDGAAWVRIVFKDESVAESRGWLDCDIPTDLALLYVRDIPKSAKAMSLSPNRPNKAERVIALGSPLHLQHSVTDGIVSSIREGVEVSHVVGLGPHEGIWIQHAAPISSGNSGGPLINMLGEIVGLNTVALPAQKGQVVQTINFATAAENIRRLLDRGENTIRPYRELPLSDRELEHAAQRRAEAKAELAILGREIETTTSTIRTLEKYVKNLATERHTAADRSEQITTLCVQLEYDLQTVNGRVAFLSTVVPRNEAEYQTTQLLSLGIAGRIQTLKAEQRGLVVRDSKLSKAIVATAANISVLQTRLSLLTANRKRLLAETKGMGR